MYIDKINSLIWYNRLNIYNLIAYFNIKENNIEMKTLI